MKPGGTPARITRTGSFTLPCEPLTALALFTPEGERAWVEGWAPTYLSKANDERRGDCSDPGGRAIGSPARDPNDDSTFKPAPRLHGQVCGRRMTLTAFSSRWPAVRASSAWSSR